MTNQNNELRSRIESELSQWPITGAPLDMVAQAIIENLHLTVEARDHFILLGNNGLRREVASTRIVGVWEAAND